MITHTIDQFILDPKSKEDKVMKLKNLLKFKIFEFEKKNKKTLHMIHLLKLLDKMCKYEMDLASIVEDRERTRFCPQTDGPMDRQTDKVKPVYPLQLRKLQL